MYIITILLLTILIPTLQAARPTLKLTFTPAIRYMSHRQQVEILCELVNPNDRTDSPQLWYVDLKTNKRTLISRSLLTSPTIDAPDIFKTNQNKRYEYIRKNHLRIRSLQMDDSAKYECDCPECEEQVKPDVRDLYVMKLTEPKWIIEPNTPLHENTEAKIKCQVDDFYPYVVHKIVHNHQEITNTGKSSLSNTNAFPQKFTWEATITPTAAWHNTTLRCTITEGNTDQQITKTLDILFAPRFIQCNEGQYVDTNKNLSSIECTYSGNPRPTLTWYRQNNPKPITSDIGLTIDTKDELNGKYKSILTFDRNKILSIPFNSQLNLSGDNSFQQLLYNGFLVKLTLNGNDKGTRNITIVRDANQIRSKVLESNSTKMSLSFILFAFLFIRHIIIIQR